MTDEYDSLAHTPLTPPSPVEENGETQDAPTFGELAYRHRDAYTKLCEVVANETSRTLLELLVDYDGGGVSYGMVLDYVDVSRWTVKMKTYELRDAGIVEVTDTGITLVEFAEDIYLALSSDVLHNYYSSSQT